MSKQVQPNNQALWKARFYAPMVLLTQIARANPVRGLAVTNQQLQVFQLYTWDVPTGRLRQLTERPEGMRQGWLSPDGAYVYYFADEKGNELGHIFRVPFSGGEAEDVTPHLLPYTLRGCEMSQAGNLLAFNPINQEGFQLYCVEIGQAGDLGTPRMIYQSQQETWQSVLSYHGEVVAAQSTARAGGMRRYSVLAFDTASGKQIGELWDGAEHSVEPVAFAPLAGDFRLLATTTRSGFKRPLIWNPLTGERTDLALSEVEGELVPLDWSPDGEQILLSHLHQATQQLYLYDLTGDSLKRLNHPAGSFAIFGGTFGKAAYFGPQGDIFAHWQDAAHPLQLIALDGETGSKKRTVLAAGEVPAGQPWQSVTFKSSDGQEVQGWLGVPPGEGPFPTILEMHGGPHVVMTESFDPLSQAWLDHGFAYLTINYRGSTTFGRQFQEKIWGNVGHWELEDMIAARNWLIKEKIARPDAILLHGASYGGFLTLLGLGKAPDLWAGGLALVAIADWTMNYQDASDALKGAFRAWFGGSPEEKPAQYVASSPITYAEQVRKPLLVIQGFNDTRTTARQMEQYEAKMKALGKEIEVEWFDAGHGRLPTEQMIGFQQRMLDFASHILQ